MQKQGERNALYLLASETDAQHRALVPGIAPVHGAGRICFQTLSFCFLKPKDVKPKLCNLDPPLPLASGILMVLCPVPDVLPSVAEPLTLDLLALGLSDEVRCSPHHSAHEAVL